MPKKKKEFDLNDMSWIDMQCKKYSGEQFNSLHRLYISLVDPNDAPEVISGKKKPMVVREKFDKYCKKGGRFLDLGCNAGDACQFAKEYFNMEVLGVDLPPIIEKIEYDIPTKAMNLEKEFPEGQWDFIFCTEVVEHLRNGEAFIKKVVNALSDNGIAFMSAPCTETDFGPVCPDHWRLYKNDELKEEVKKAGGAVREFYGERRSKFIIFSRKGK